MPLSPFVRHAAAVAAFALAGCSSLEPVGPPAAETVWAVTDAQELIRFNAGQPQRVLARRPVTGLAAGDALVGIDFRVARGVLYALGASGQLYTLDTATGRLDRVGAGNPALPLAGVRVGFDFNPAADRIRVVTAGGQNLRLHPDTGMQVDSDPNTAGVQDDTALAYPAGDPNAGRAPQLMAAGYTYNKRNDKFTTNFAIDGRSGALVMQGSREGSDPVVSPNTGRLTTIGALGTGALADAALDIADLTNTAYAALRRPDDGRTRWYRVDLVTGRATLLGTPADGRALVGIAIEP